MKATELIAVMPVYNEQDNIATVIMEWLDAFSREGVRCSLIAVNDGSTDGSLSILRKLEVQFPDRIEIIDKANSGHGRSCRAGYDAAVQRGAPWILQIDSDGQCDPAFFPQFWSKRREADCVFGVRVTRDDGRLRKLISTASRVLTSIAAGRDLRDVNVPYRLIGRAALQQALATVPEDFDLQNIALTLALKRNSTLRWAHIPIRFRARQGGTNSINFPKIAKMGFTMLKDLHQVRQQDSAGP